MHERDQVGWLEFVPFAALVDAREVEDILDQRRETATFLHDEPEVLGLFLRFGDFPAVKALGHEAHGGDWRAQLVRHAGDEIGFHLRQPLLAIKTSPGSNEPEDGRPGRQDDEAAKHPDPLAVPRKKQFGIGQHQVKCEREIAARRR